MSNELKKSLLEETSITGALVVSAIHGLGGIGKSTLVAALAHNQDIRKRFPDGILWATLGQQPDVLSLLTSWIQALGDYKFSPTNIDVASRQLCSLLDRKAILLVVDDVWNADHALPFRVGGSQCRVLVTTRNADIAVVLDATLLELGVMKLEQALALLEGRINRKIQTREHQQACNLANAVGYLPLALELAAAQIKDGISFSELLENLEAEIARLEVLNLPGFEDANNEMTRKKLSLLASFNLSLKKLSAEKLQRFAWLGVVPEDVKLTQHMVTTLWETNLWEARETLRYLKNKALLLEDIPLDDGTHTYRLHDLVHDISRRLLTDSPNPKKKEDLPGLGLTLKEAHSELINRYRKLTTDGLWHQLPDDGYIHFYLAWHIEKTACEEQLHKLLQEETEEGKNGWYQAREKLGQVTGYLGDVNRAWKLAEEAFTKDQSVKSIGLQIRYALITASLNSIADNITPELLGALVKQKVWTVDQGLAYARQKTQSDEKSLALASIAPYVKNENRSKIFLESITTFEEPKGVLNISRFELEKSIINGYRYILNNIEISFSEDLLNEFLDILNTFTTDNKIFGLDLLSCHDLYIEEERVRLQLLKEIKRFIDAKIKNLKQLPYLGEELEQLLYHPTKEPNIRNRNVSEQDLEGWITICKDLEGFSEQLSRTLDSLLFYLSKKTQTIFLEELDEKINTFEEITKQEILSMCSETITEKILSAVTEEFTQIPGYINDIRHFILQTQSYRDFFNYNRELFDYDRDLLDYDKELFDYNRDFFDCNSKNSINNNLVLLNLNNTVILLYIFLECSIKNIRTIWRVNVAKSSHTNETHITQQSQLQDMLINANFIQDDVERVKILAKLAPYLSQTLKINVLSAISSMQDENNMVIALIDLIPYLSDCHLNIVLRITRDIRGDEYREKVFKKLISKLPDSQKDNLLKETLEIITQRCLTEWQTEKEKSIQQKTRIKEVNEFLVEAMVQLVKSIPYSLKENILEQIISMANGIESDLGKKVAISKLVPYLNNCQLEELLPVVRKLEDKNLLVDIIVKLAPNITNSLLEEGLNAAQIVVEQIRQAETSIGNKKRDAEEEISTILMKLAPYFQNYSDLLTKAIMLARKLKNLNLRTHTIAVLSCYLPQSQGDIIFQEDVLNMIKTDGERSSSYKNGRDYLAKEVLNKIASYLSESLLNNALEIAKTINNSYFRRETLITLISCFPQSEQASLLSQYVLPDNIEKFGPLEVFELIQLKSDLSQLTFLELREKLWTKQAIETWEKFTKVDEVSRKEKLAVDTVLLIPYFPEDMLDNVFKTTLIFTTQINNNTTTSLLELIGVYLSQLSSDRIYPLWCDVVHILARRTRKDFLYDLRALIPVIQSLGATETIEEMAVAIQDVGRWWS
ncbi:MAG: NB-ARC domain-containing protein [Crocosphaera sp.]